MRTFLRSKVTLLFLAFAVAIFAVSGAAMALTSPTITSDLPDYGPGQLVTLTGGGWQPGERVHINVNDDQTQTWSRDVDVVADANGNITDQFELPGWFVATYQVTATGDVSGTVTTSFTDAIKAQASVDKKDSYRGKSDEQYTFTVTNTSDVAGETLSSLRIVAPNSAWTLTGCSTTRSNWTSSMSGGNCFFERRTTTPTGTAIPKGGSAQFTVTADISAGAADIINNSGNNSWEGTIKVSPNSPYANSDASNATAANAGDLAARAYVFEVKDAVVATSAATVGGACPSPNKSAPAGSSRAIVVCGRQESGTSLTPISTNSSLGGTMIGTAGTFGSNAVSSSNNDNDNVVLANYTNTTITSPADTNRTVVAKIGAANSGSTTRTSPLTTLSGYEAISPNTAPNATVPTFNPASPKTNDSLQASTTTSDAENNNVSVAWVWKVTRGANTCQVNTETSPSAAPATRTVSLDLTQSYTTSNCTGTTPPASINPSKGDTVIAEATPNDGTVNGTTRSNNVAIANTAPVANNDNYSVNEGATLNVAAPGVLGNDTDADSNPLTATLVGTGPSHASSFTLNSDGSFVYTHDGSETTTDSFTYKANDGTVDGNTVTVTITVVPVDDPPTAVNDSATVQEDDPATAIDVLTNDDNADGGPKTISSASDPAKGTVVLTGGSPGAHTGLTYQPDPNYCNDPPGTSPDTFTYTLNGGSTATVSVKVTCVNDAPVLDLNGGDSGVDSSATFTEDGGAVAIAGALTVTDVDDTNMESAKATLTNHPDGSDESLSVNTSGTSITAQAYNTTTGVLSLSGSASKAQYEQVLRSVKYNNTSQNPDATDRLVKFVVNDGDLDSANPNGTVSVISVNDAPDAASQSVTTAEDTSKSITLSATDVDSGTLTYKVTALPAHGKLYDGATQITSANTTLSGNEVTYKPDDNYNNTGGTNADTFKFVANDGDLNSSEATVDVTVTPVNDVPTANAQSVTTNEDTQKSITLTGTDVDGDSLTYNIVSGPTHGTLSTGTGATRTYTPAADYNGPDSFTFKVSDGQVDSAPVTVSITVNSVNDVPSFTKGADQTVLKNSGLKTVTDWATGISKGPNNEANQTLEFQVSNNNTDLFSVQPAISSDGTLTFTPATDAVGKATVTVSLKDSGGTANGGIDTSAAQTFNINVTYNWTGFFSPVDNPTSATSLGWNSAKAGQSIPFKFGLAGNQGLSVLNGAPRVTSVTCPTPSTSLDAIEEYATTTNNGLVYDSTANQYNYVWKTQSTYANKCIKFDMELMDGTHHEAYFKFTK